MSFIVNESMGFLLAQNAKKTNVRFVELLREKKIEFGHSGWIVLSRLWEEDGLTLDELAVRANVAVPNIAAYCEQLEKQNYISKTPVPNEKKNFKISLTPKGKEYKETSVVLMQQANSESSKGLTQTEQSELKRILLKMHRVKQP